jgi:hypothetical protein
MMIVRFSSIRAAFFPPVKVALYHCKRRIGGGSQTSSRRSLSSKVQNPADGISPTKDDIGIAHAHTSSGSGGIGLHNVRDRTFLDVIASVACWFYEMLHYLLCPPVGRPFRYKT